MSCAHSWLNRFRRLCSTPALSMRAVWSRGGSFHHGLHAALADPPHPRARASIPTTRTIRRWWHERRWLQPPAADPASDRDALAQPAAGADQRGPAPSLAGPT